MVSLNSDCRDVSLTLPGSGDTVAIQRLSEGESMSTNIIQFFLAVSFSASLGALAPTLDSRMQSGSYPGKNWEVAKAPNGWSAEKLKITREYADFIHSSAGGIPA